MKQSKRKKEKEDNGERYFSIFYGHYETGFHTPITSGIEYKYRNSISCAERAPDT